MGSPAIESTGQRLISVCVNSSDFPLLIRASSGLPTGLQNLLRGFNSFRPCQYEERDDVEDHLVVLALPTG